MTQNQRESKQEQWFDQIVDQYQSPLISYATRILCDADRAKDAVQNAFIKLYRSDDQKIENYIAPWLYRVVRNQALNIKRKEKRMIKHSEPEVFERVSEETKEVDRTETLFDLVHTLPPPKDELIMLKFRSGFSYKEISSITGLSVSNVGYQLHHAIRELKASWDALETQK